MSNVKLKPLDDFVGVDGYHAGDDGNIYSTRQSDEPRKLSKQVMHDYYYSKVNDKMVRVHRLIAWAFCKGYKADLVVNHIDENKKNNKPSNLEWVTQKENVNHKRAKGGDLMSDKEVRHLQLDEIEIRKSDDSIESFSGYVVKFNTRSHFLGFYETVDRRAFDKTLKSNNNVFMLYNHDFNQILGSTRNATLELSTDDTGLKFTLTPKANTSFMNDVRELVESGELRGCSFGFRVVDDEWTTKDNHDYRTLKEIELFETTLTAMPAYESSEVSVRSYDNYRQEREQQEQRNKDLELLQLHLDLIKMKQQ